MRMILYIIKANVLQRSHSYGEGCLTPSMCKKHRILREAR